MVDCTIYKTSLKPSQPVFAAGCKIALQVARVACIDVATCTENCSLGLSFFCDLGLRSSTCDGARCPVHLNQHTQELSRLLGGVAS